MQEILHVLLNITKEPPIISQPSHGSAHLLNTPMYERKYARAYLDQQNSQDMRIQIIRGAKEALEEQYVSPLTIYITRLHSRGAILL